MGILRNKLLGHTTYSRKKALLIYVEEDEDQKKIIARSISISTVIFLFSEAIRLKITRGSMGAELEGIILATILAAFQT